MDGPMYMLSKWTPLKQFSFLNIRSLKICRFSLLVRVFSQPQFFVQRTSESINLALKSDVMHGCSVLFLASWRHISTFVRDMNVSPRSSSASSRYLVRIEVCPCQISPRIPGPNCTFGLCNKLHQHHIFPAHQRRTFLHWCHKAFWRHSPWNIPQILKYWCNILWKARSRCWVQNIGLVSVVHNACTVCWNESVVGPWNVCHLVDSFEQSRRNNKLWWPGGLRLHIGCSNNSEVLASFWISDDSCSAFVLFLFEEFCCCSLFKLDGAVVALWDVLLARVTFARNVL